MRKILGFIMLHSGKNCLLFSILGYLALFAAPTFGKNAVVAVASNFSKPAKVLVSDFQAHSPYSVTVSTASSGKLYAQIVQGAPFDIFLSADQAKPIALEKQALIVKGSRFTYATGKLVLWSRTLQIDKDLSLFTQGRFKKLAIANPTFAPYGIAATELLNQLTPALDTSGKIVMGENISQTYQFVATKNADLGFVALSQIKSTNSDPGYLWLPPTEAYNPIRQDAVLLKRAETNAAANAFFLYLKSQQALEIISSLGYKITTPAGEPNAIK